MPRIISMIYILVFSLISCADSPESPVPPTKKDTDNSEPLDSETVKAMALKYQGTDSRGRKCDIYIAINEEEHEDHDHEGHDHEHEEDHHLLVKVDFTTGDGHKPHAGEGEFYFYKKGTYYNTDQDGAQLSLVSMALKESHEGEEALPNSLSDYMNDGELEQFMKIGFSDQVDHDEFIEALEESTEDKTTLQSNMNTLDNIESLYLALAHGDHYHEPSCSNYTLEGVEEVEFEMDGHDHDHGHDHD